MFAALMATDKLIVKPLGATLSAVGRGTSAVVEEVVHDVAAPVEWTARKIRDVV